MIKTVLILGIMFLMVGCASVQKLSSKNTLSEAQVKQITAQTIQHNPGKAKEGSGLILGFAPKQNGKDLLMVLYTTENYKEHAYPVYEKFSRLPSPFGNNVESIIFIKKNKSGECYQFYRARNMKETSDKSAKKGRQLTGDVKITVIADMQGMSNLHFKNNNHWKNVINSMEISD